MSAPDLTVYDGGSVVLIQPVTVDAVAWMRAHLPDDAPMLGNAVAVERRYVSDIIRGALEDGLGVA